MARKIAVVCVWLGLVSPAGVHALGLGDIHVRSALNQPLDADIELISATQSELEDLEVALAPRETFDRYGIDRPGFLSGLAFEVDRSAAGESVLHVTTARPVSEPFLTFLIEASWPRGRLLREYTVLLDPPTYLPDDGKATPAPARVEDPRVEDSPAPAGAGPISRPAQPAAEPVRPAPARAASRPAGGGEYGPVVRNETLWAIANRMRADSGITVNQMMIALYRANPEAFGDNINLLRAGAVLRVPESATFDALDVGEANSEVQQHNSAWQSGREAVAASATGTSEAASARLRLVAPDDAGSGEETAGDRPPEVAAGDDAATLRRQVSELEAQLEETQRLIELKDSELAALQARLAEQDAAVADAAEPGAPGVDLETGTAEETGEAAATPQPAAGSPRPAPAREEGGLLDGIAGLFGSTWLYVGLGIALVLASLLIFARRRREPARPVGRWQALDAEAERAAPAAASVARTQRLRALPDEDESFVVVEQGAGAAARRTAAAAGRARPARETGREPKIEEPAEEDTLSSATAIHLDHADPLAEADFHMAYGLYDQAAELVRKAADKEPKRRDLRMKLLEIYFVWGNEQAFLDEARRLHESMQGELDADWDKTLIMGKQICADEPLFAGEPGADAGRVDLDLADSGGGAASVDFLTGEGGGTDLDLDLGEADAARDLEDTGRVATGDALDFDFGDETAGETGRHARSEGSTIQSSGFESATVETPTLEQPGPESPTIESPTIESTRFDESTMETPTIEQRIESVLESGGGSDQTAEIDLDDLGLDLEDLRDDTLGGALDDDATILASADLEGRHERDEDFDPGLTTPAPGGGRRDRDATAEVPHRGRGRASTRDIDATSEFDSLDRDSLDIDLEDLSAALDTSDTAAQPALTGGDNTVRQRRHPAAGREDDSLDVDLTEILTEDDTAFAGARDFDLGDLGETESDSEVGTKLDLARAYMDMGDPEGAHSILQEVLEEGDTSQREEAQRLLNALP